MFPDEKRVPVGKIKDAFVPSRITGLIDALAEFGRQPNGGISRVAFSRADERARSHYLDVIQRELKVTVRIDAAGNIIARRQGTQPHWPALITGSHLDTVPNGGAFDGTAGVAAGVEAFRVLDQLAIHTRHPLELIVFTAEEPNPFGLATFGSRVMCGRFDQAAIDGCVDFSGLPLKDALRRIGGDGGSIRDAVRSPGSVAAFVELHIEQMPGLEKAGKTIGIVTEITGLQRHRITVEGEAAHSGTTLMSQRKDALCGAADIILAVERAARQEAAPTVATVGRLAITPNATNVVAGQVCLEAEARSCDPDALKRMSTAMQVDARAVAQQRGLTVTAESVYAAPPQSFSPAVGAAIGEAAATLGLPAMQTVSMAGHDAMHMNGMADAGMIFIPCRGGLSHCPQEWAAPDDLLRGAQCLLLTLLKLDGREWRHGNGVGSGGQ